MKYEHKQEETRWYEYGPEKEFKTKDEAIKKLESDTREGLSNFYLEGLYKLLEEMYNEDNGKAVRKVIKFKYPISILK